VLGISKTVVTPPMVAAVDPEAKSSRLVNPGSRKWTCGSITPGRMYAPATSMTSLESGRDDSRPIAVITPSLMATPPWMTCGPMTSRPLVSTMSLVGPEIASSPRSEQ
jgi:hypothetical protein